MDQRTAELRLIIETAHIYLATLYSLCVNFNELCSNIISRNIPTLENTPTQKYAHLFMPQYMLLC